MLAIEESHVDVLIVKHAVQMAPCYQNVMVIAHDTHELILLISCNKHDILVFGDSSASLKESVDVGELFVQSL